MARILYIVMEIEPGVSLGQAALDACKLALQHSCNVKYRFNKEVYMVEFSKFYLIPTLEQQACKT